MPSRLTPVPGSRAFRAGAVVAGLAGLYALAGFQVAPGIVRDQARQFVEEKYGRELAVGEVRVQPFKLQLEVRDLALPDADGAPMLGFEHLFVDIELASLWRRTLVFRDVTLEAPHLRAVVRPDGRVNLADLALPKDPEDEDAGLAAVWLQALTVDRGVIEFVDQSRREQFARRFERVAFALQDFRTTPEGGDFRFSARGQSDESIDWKGNFTLEPVISSRGEIALDNLGAQDVADFLGDALPFAVSSGRARLNGIYSVSLGESLALDLALPTIELTDAALRARGVDADWVTVPSLVVADTAVALPAQTVSIAKVTVAGLAAQAWIEPGGKVNLQRLFAPATVPTAPADGSAVADIPTGPVASEVSARAWKVDIANVELAGATIDFEDRLAEPAKKFAIAPLALTVAGVSLDLAKPLPVTLAATVNGEALVRTSGTITPQPFTADLDLSLDEARMQILQPYILPVADLTITAGTLAVQGKARITPPEQDGPEMSFAGAVTIDGFASQDNALRQDFVNFRRLELRQVEFDRGPDALTIDQVRVAGPYARLIVSEERVVNIAAVLDPAGTAAALETRKAAAAAESAMSPADKRRRDRELAAAKQAEDKARKARGKQPSAAPVRAVQGPDTFPIRVREVRIDGGRLNFSDHFIQPNFSADIQGLRGTIRGISSAHDSRAKVDLDGNLGEFSPVSIAGELQPFAFDRYTDLAFDFENIALPVFNPYSGRLAGYNIAKGKLTTTLHYRIEDRKLDAAHEIRIDQLEWGEATANKGEATLPVKFATALLRDRNGVINLDIPIKGTLDDPTFRIGPIVWQIIRNIIVKAVTAPFALLGSLFAGAEEAQFVDFSPGDATVSAATAEKLVTLAKGLGEKPGIKVDVPMGAVDELDEVALADRAYERQRAAAVAAVQRRKVDDATPPPAFDALERKQKIAVLKALLGRQGGPVPEVPEPPAPPEGTPRAEAKVLRDDAEIEFLAKEARARVVVTDAEVEALGEERGHAIERILLTDTGLEPTRVFVSRNGKVAAQDGKVRFELGLQ
ncbi:MAG: DUF748 domain-containing protein [Steroidobacteraceae bacterium]